MLIVMLEIHREIDGILTLNLQKNTVKIQLYKNICILKSKKKSCLVLRQLLFCFPLLAKTFTFFIKQLYYKNKKAILKFIQIIFKCYICNQINPKSWYTNFVLY